MAKIRYSALLDSIKGKVGSTIFSTWKGIPYIKSMPVVVHNPLTSSQGEIRSSLSSVTNGWKFLPMQTQRLWKEYAQGLGRAPDNISQLGDTQLIKTSGHTMSGFNAYCSANFRLSYLNEPLTIFPPETTPPGIREVTVTQAFGHYLIEVSTFNGAEEGDIIRMFVRTNWKGGHTYQALTFKLGPADINNGVGNHLFQLNELRLGHESTIQAEDLLILFGREFSIQFDVVRLNGAVSNPSKTTTIRIDGDVDSAVGQNMLTLWEQASAGFKTDMLNYINQMYWAWDPTVVTEEEASFFYFITALFNFAAVTPAINLATSTKSNFETEGFPVTLAELGAAQLIPTQGVDLTALTTEW